MKRMMIALFCSGVLGVAGLAVAQTGTTSRMNHDTPGKEMKVTGCVAQGNESGHYMLTDAMPSGDAMKKDTMKHDDMKSMSYALMGGDLKMHVGHKVEVTGATTDSAMKDAAAPNPANGKDTTDMHMLTVKSVRMISATCS